MHLARFIEPSYTGVPIIPAATMKSLLQFLQRVYPILSLSEMSTNIKKKVLGFPRIKNKIKITHNHPARSISRIVERLS
jgi:hypothetical protein